MPSDHVKRVDAHDRAKRESGPFVGRVVVARRCRGVIGEADEAAGLRQFHERPAWNPQARPDPDHRKAGGSTGIEMLAGKLVGQRPPDP